MKAALEVNDGKLLDEVNLDFREQSRQDGRQGKDRASKGTEGDKM